MLQLCYLSANLCLITLWACGWWKSITPGHWVNVTYRLPHLPLTGTLYWLSQREGGIACWVVHQMIQLSALILFIYDSAYTCLHKVDTHISIDTMLKIKRNPKTFIPSIECQHCSLSEHSTIPFTIRFCKILFIWVNDFLWSPVIFQVFNAVAKWATASAIAVLMVRGPPHISRCSKKLASVSVIKASNFLSLRAANLQGNSCFNWQTAGTLVHKSALPYTNSMQLLESDGVRMQPWLTPMFTGKKLDMPLPNIFTTLPILKYKIIQ